jgi:hypothetical protein
MLLTISTTQRPAIQLAQRLGQHPDAVRAATFPFGHAMVCFPQADEARCSAAVMVQHPGRPPQPSLLAAALGDLFADVRLADDSAALPVDVDIPVLACPGGPDRLGHLFGPRGYHVTTAPVTADECSVRLTGTATLGDLLDDLCTLLPALQEAAGQHVRRARYAACAHQ